MKYDPKPIKSKRPRHRRRSAPGNRELWELFKRTVLARDGGCLMRKGGVEFGCSMPLQAAHLFPKQRLKRDGHGAEVIYDPRSAIALCEWHHRRHDSFREPVPKVLVPAEVLEFWEQLGFFYVDKTPVSPPRAEAMQATERAEASDDSMIAAVILELRSRTREVHRSIEREDTHSRAQVAGTGERRADGY